MAVTEATPVQNDDVLVARGPGKVRDCCRRRLPLCSFGTTTGTS